MYFNLTQEDKMAQVIEVEVSDKVYNKLEEYAKEDGISIETLAAQILEDEADAIVGDDDDDYDDDETYYNDSDSEEDEEEKDKVPFDYDD
jgi:hypothetical protein